MKVLNFTLSVLIGVMIIVAGCSERDSDMDHDDNDTTMTSMQRNKYNAQNNSAWSDSNRVTAAIAVLNPTQENDVKGTISFQKASGGVRVHADVSGLTEGEHGFHVHLYGDCSASDATSAGTHYDFQKGGANDSADYITGNLGNLNAGANGQATADTLIENATLNGPKAIIGRAVVVHEKANDPSQPPIGAAGARLGCGVIGIAKGKAAADM